MTMNNKLFSRAAFALAVASLPGLLYAQKAGDIISGVIEDNEGPMMMVNVTERDAADRIVAHAITDIEGNFSFRLVNPKDRIQFSFYRKERIILPIDKAYFEIRMEDDKNLPPVSWEEYEPLDSRDVKEKAGRKHYTCRLDPNYPEREAIK